MNNRKNRKGFTIVELVIVIAVIAILAGVLIPTFANVVKKAQISAAEQEAANAYKEAYALAIADGKIEGKDKDGKVEENKETQVSGDYRFTFNGTIDKINSVGVEVLTDSGAAKDNLVIVVTDGVVSAVENGADGATENTTGSWTN